MQHLNTEQSGLHDGLQIYSTTATATATTILQLSGFCPGPSG